MNPDIPTTYALDRFEDDGWAVLEDEQGASFRVPRAWLPNGAQEGDVLRLEPRPVAPPGVGDRVRELRMVVDEMETRRRRDEAQTLWESLPRGPEGDLEL